MYESQAKKQFSAINTLVVTYRLFPFRSVFSAFKKKVFDFDVRKCNSCILRLKDCWLYVAGKTTAFFDLYLM